SGMRRFWRGILAASRPHAAVMPTSADPIFSLGPEPMSPAQIFFGFKGRIDRRTWWLYGVVALIALGLVGMALLRIAGFNSTTAENAINLLLLWPALAVSIK